MGRGPVGLRWGVLPVAERGDALLAYRKNEIVNQPEAPPSSKGLLGYFEGIGTHSFSNLGRPPRN